MKILVCGGRNYQETYKLVYALDLLNSKYPITVLVHGNSSGADLLAARWAETANIEVIAYPADWSIQGRSAGPIRNRRMLNENKDIGMVVAFPGGRGTRNMISLAENRNIAIWIPYDM